MINMKFAHMADLHIGGWHEPKMSSLTIGSFRAAAEECIRDQVDFIIISGDLFNTSVPNIDYIKDATLILKKLGDNNIPVYIVAGSHDYSPSGKTMLDVLENAGLLQNVVKAKNFEEGRFQLLFTQDKKTGAKLAGMLGKRAMLEKSFYESLDKSNLESETGFKIFLFHTALDELKPEELSNMESSPVSLLPKGFDYYAGGHVHIVKHHSVEGYKNLVYPGPLFPNSFSELEKLHSGGYYMYSDGRMEYKKIQLKHVVFLKIDCENKTPEQAELSLYNDLKYRDVKDKIVLIRMKGKLKIGKLAEINMNAITHSLYENGAYFVMKNTSAVSSEGFEEIRKSFRPDQIEQEVIAEHLGQIKVDGLLPEKEKEMISHLISALSKEKQEGETNMTYEDRIVKDLGFLYDWDN
jgi:DNA repair protein SbcD/Mre11